MNILYSTFFIPLYISPIAIYHILDCVWFVSILNLNYLIRKLKKRLVSYDWWSIKKNTKNEIKYLYSIHSYFIWKEEMEYRIYIQNFKPSKSSKKERTIVFLIFFFFQPIKAYKQEDTRTQRHKDMIFLNWSLSSLSNGSHHFLKTVGSILFLSFFRLVFKESMILDWPKSYTWFRLRKNSRTSFCSHSHVMWKTEAK